MPKATRASEIISNFWLDNNLDERSPLPEFIRNIAPTNNYFHIHRLQKREPIPDHIFNNDDFIFYLDKANPRASVTIKMGSLLIQYCANGKGSYELDVKFIDREMRQTRSMFHFDGARYPSFQFDDIMPFALGGSLTTMVERVVSPVIPYANRLRDIFTNMALNQAVPQVEFQAAAANFFIAVQASAQPVAQQPQVTTASHASGFFQPLQERDVNNFAGEDFKNKPRNETELAAKLAVCFFLDLGVDEEKFKQIISEYIDETGILFEEMNSHWIESVMTKLIDKGRYCLQTVLPEETSGCTLSKAINDIKQEQEQTKQNPSISS